MSLQVFIGWDAREKTAWHVCAASMQARSSYPVNVQPISRPQLEAADLYWRTTRRLNGRLLDEPSGEYCSTDFSLARFWVPYIAGRTGWALFCDCDFLWRADVWDLFALADPRYAVMVVPNRHEATPGEKMDGQHQSGYWRKNWSSLMLWNLAHTGARRLGLFDLNTKHKHALHAFDWLADNEIGFLPQGWNWLEGVSEADADPKAVHFTRGTPDMAGYEHSQFAGEWRRYADSLAAGGLTKGAGQCLPENLTA